MYLDHFGLAQKPFALTPDPGFLYLSRKHGVALAMLEYGLHEQAGLTVLTGGVGHGKTTLLRKLLLDATDNSQTVGLINNTHESFGSLLECACLAFNLGDIPERPIAQLQQLQDFVIAEYAAGRSCVLIIDEAQNLAPSTLEQVRLLTNINNEGDLLLHVLLSGQPELQQMLLKPELRQLAQRVTSECHLGALDQKDTEHYLKHRMKAAGLKVEDDAQFPFDRPSRAAIYYFSGGTPRLINKIADYSLLIAFAKDEAQVDVAAVLEVVQAQKIARPRPEQRAPDAPAVRQNILELTGVDIDPGEGAIPTLKTRSERIPDDELHAD